MAGCGCSRRCEKLLWWLGWRSYYVGPPATGSYVFETPEVTVLLPTNSVAHFHARAAVLGLLVRALFGRNRVEGEPVPVWQMQGTLPRAEQLRYVAAHPIVWLEAQKRPDGSATTWGAPWFPVVRPRAAVPPPAELVRLAEGGE